MHRYIPSHDTEHCYLCASPPTPPRQSVSAMEVHITKRSQERGTKMCFGNKQNMNLNSRTTSLFPHTTTDTPIQNHPWDIMIGHIQRSAPNSVFYFATSHPILFAVHERPAERKTER